MDEGSGRQTTRGEWMRGQEGQVVIHKKQKAERERKSSDRGERRRVDETRKGRERERTSYDPG